MIAQVFIHHIELPYLEMFVGQDIIDPQCGRQGNEAAANTKAFFKEGVLPAVLDMEISEGVGHIIEIAAENGGVRTGIQRFPHPGSLYAPPAEGQSHLHKNILRRHQGFFVLRADLLQVVVVAFFEFERLQVRGKQSYGIGVFYDIRVNKTFGHRVSYPARVYDGIFREDDAARLVLPVVTLVIFRKKIIRKTAGKQREIIGIIA